MHCCVAKMRVKFHSRTSNRSEDMAKKTTNGAPVICNPTCTCKIPPLQELPKVANVATSLNFVYRPI